MYGGGFGYNVGSACSNYGAYVYQQSGYYAPLQNSYITYNNCMNTYCDWSGQYGYYLYGYGTVYSVNYNCGYVDFQNSYSCSYSDVALKSGIETLQNALENIMNIEAVEYDWNENLNETAFAYFKKQQKLHTIGLIAQNVRLYYPEAINMNHDGYYSIDYQKLNAVLVEGIKQQEVFIEDIDKQLEYIESKLN